MDSITFILEIGKKILDVIVVPIVIVVGWIIRKYYETNSRIQKVEDILMDKHGEPKVVTKDRLEVEVRNVTVNFTSQHDEIRHQFEGKVNSIEGKIDNIKEDIDEIKDFIAADNQHKIDLAATLSGIKTELNLMRKGNP